MNLESSMLLFFDKLFIVQRNAERRGPTCIPFQNLRFVGGMIIVLTTLLLLLFIIIIIIIIVRIVMMIRQVPVM
jgi:hypothetical protein